ncbi:MAG: DUF5924 family protein [Acidobacteriota bacterium]
MKLVSLVRHFIDRHQEQLWWIHSAYALLFGIGVMWLGSRSFVFLRLAFFYVLFIWLSSLGLPRLVRSTLLSPVWQHRARLLLNYLNRNFYQQVLFFILPVYAASSTLWSRNFLFVVLLALSAVVSTLDVVYDRHLTVRRSLIASFFAFNLFACVNVILPAIWGVSNTFTMKLSAVLAVMGFLTLYATHSEMQRREVQRAIAISALFLFALVWKGASFVPPAPLRLVSVQFGTGFNREAMQIPSPLSTVPAEVSTPLVGLTAIYAPLGLSEQVGHRWYVDGKLVFVSPYYWVSGGRERGFRLWTQLPAQNLPAKKSVRLDVLTTGGQLIGRRCLQPG